MKIKYYIIPVDGNDGYDAAYMIATHQGIAVEDVVILNQNDISQIFKVPYLQDYKGLALVIKSCEILSKNIDIASMITKDNTVVFDNNKNIFIINCESPLIINAFSPRIVTTVDLSSYLSFQGIGNSNDWILDNSLRNYFDCTANPVNETNLQDTNEEIIELSYNEDTDVFEG